MTIQAIENFMEKDVHDNLVEAQKFLPIIGVFPAAVHLLVSVTEIAVGALLFLSAGITGCVCWLFSDAAAENCFKVAWLGESLALEGCVTTIISTVNIISLGFLVYFWDRLG